MLRSHITLTQYLIEERANHPSSSGAFNSAILAISVTCKALAGKISRSALSGHASAKARGEKPRTLDSIAHETFVHCLQNGVNMSGMISDNNQTLVSFEDQSADYLLAVVPLDGAANIDLNLSVGSIFSVLRREDSATGPLSTEEFLQCGAEQVAAGYVIYGPATVLVLSVGNGTHAFTLNTEIGEFLLTQRDMRVPENGSEFAINASNSRFWDAPIKRYIEECLAGSEGPREKNFNMRWIASLVAEAHRIFQRGGVFMSPRHNQDDDATSHLRLLYEVNPIAFLIEQAGGRASTAKAAVLDVAPSEAHQCSGFVFGSRNEVERIERYSNEPEQQYVETPLFNTRGLFRHTD